ncbi:hypothetical protein [Paenibacillus sp. FSL E2-0177]|uniref:hypothetical protein n=1 Tax=Paenibacillus sp. FSL E2-0177 TaxID=2921360 RepID=UPI0030ECEFD8
MLNLRIGSSESEGATESEGAAESDEATESEGAAESAEATESEGAAEFDVVTESEGAAESAGASESDRAAESRSGGFNPLDVGAPESCSYLTGYPVCRADSNAQYSPQIIKNCPLLLTI